MIFQHTWEKVLSGHKTQTRRVVDPRYSWMGCLEQGIVMNPGGRVKYQVGKTYAVQPGRGQPAIIYNPDHPCYGVDIIQPGDSSYVAAKDGRWPYKGQGYTDARIRITDIRREDVRQISDEDVKAEGFGTRVEFWQTWVSMHDNQFKKLSENQSWWPIDDILRMFLKDRPNARYDAWALTFELSS